MYYPHQTLQAFPIELGRGVVEQERRMSGSLLFLELQLREHQASGHKLLLPP